MDRELKHIAMTYVKKAEDTFAFILKLLEVGNRHELVLLVIDRKDINFLIDGREYVIMPHGRGCYFSDGNDEIDWEFGIGDTCGIDPWMLGKFIKRYCPRLYDNFDEFALAKKIASEFDEALQAGEMKRDANLYYLISR